MHCLQNNQSIFFQHHAPGVGLLERPSSSDCSMRQFPRKSMPAQKFKQIFISFLEITLHLCFESEYSWYPKCVDQLAGRMHTHVCSEIPWTMCSSLQQVEKRQGCVLQEKDLYFAAKSDKSWFSINDNSAGGIGICQLLYPCWSLKTGCNDSAACKSLWKIKCSNIHHRHVLATWTHRAGFYLFKKNFWQQLVIFSIRSSSKTFHILTSVRVIPLKPAAELAGCLSVWVDSIQESRTICVTIKYCSRTLVVTTCLLYIACICLLLML